MRTNEEINQYFTEEVFGKCWHEFKNHMPKDEGSCPWYSNEVCRTCSERFQAYDDQVGRWVPDNCPDSHIESLCLKCKASKLNSDYFKDWNGFGIIWEWAIDQEWWYTFVASLYERKIFLPPIINHKTFAREVYNFLEVNK